MKNSDGVDVEVLARKTVEVLGVAPGQVIWIWANVVSMDFIEALAFHIRERGAFWTLRLNSEPLLHRIGMDLPAEYLPLIPQHEMRWLDDINAIIELRDHGGHIPDVPIDRRRAMGTEWIALIEEAARKGIRRLMVINPTPALARAVHLPVDELQRRVMHAIDVDYSVVDSRQEWLAGLLDSTSSVHVTCPAGTDLRLRVEGRKALTDTDSIPHGEAYIAPLEDSAEGVAVIEKAFFRGKCVENLRLTFLGGKVVNVESPDPVDAESFREVLAVSTGDKDKIAEFAIATNPGVTEPIGCVAQDEKIGGSVHVAIGMNDRFGGRNKSNLHQDFVILKPTVWLDEKIVLENGEFKE
ncbi:MAG: aminopeptidase [Chloroflexi bacterium]|nr:aminopeptidase [Chloroflexota bacterium]